jgi:hypothetical protein
MQRCTFKQCKAGHMPCRHSCCRQWQAVQVWLSVLQAGLLFMDEPLMQCMLSSRGRPIVLCLLCASCLVRYACLHSQVASAHMCCRVLVLCSNYWHCK